MIQKTFLFSVKLVLNFSKDNIGVRLCGEKFRTKFVQMNRFFIFALVYFSGSQAERILKVKQFCQCYFLCKIQILSAKFLIDQYLKRGSFILLSDNLQRLEQQDYSNRSRFCCGARKSPDNTWRKTSCYKSSLNSIMTMLIFFLPKSNFQNFQLCSLGLKFVQILYF